MQIFQYWNCLLNTNKSGLVERSKIVGLSIANKMLKTRENTTTVWGKGEHRRSLLSLLFYFFSIPVCEIVPPIDMHESYLQLLHFFTSSVVLYINLARPVYRPLERSRDTMPDSVVSKSAQ